MILLIILVIVLIVILGSLKQINEYERGVKFTAGKFTKIMLPGWRIVLPIFQSYKKVDIRTKVDDVPEQEAITKDNVSVKINAVIYYKVFDASLAVLQVEDFYYATAQLAQTTMRNIVGSVTLDELLCEREKVSSQIKEIIDKETDPWGIKVENVELKDISLTDEMKRVIARAAEAEREKQAVITKSIGEKEAAENLAEAAKKLAESPGALHLRTLETINDVSSDQSNTIFFPIPMDVLEAVKGYSEKLKKENINIVLDTSGYVDNVDLKLLKLFDYILFDIKSIYPNKFKYITGGNINVIDNFINELNKINAKVIIRVVIIPGINDSNKYMLDLKKYISKIKNVIKIDFLPFHTLGFSKYQDSGIDNPFINMKAMDKRKCSKLYEYFSNIQK